MLFVTAAVYFGSETAALFFLSGAPHIPKSIFSSSFSFALGDHGGDFCGAKRSVAKSGREGSREWRGGTRLRLPSVAVAVSSVAAFSVAAIASTVGFFI
jgi:hypothetical protein